VTQVHDFNAGIGSNGLFWTVQVPDDAVTISGDTLTISLKNQPLQDTLTFPVPGVTNPGTAGIPATVSFTITYQKSGHPRQVRPTSRDPLSPFNWAGEMWTATNSGTFSVAYADGTFSAQGSFSSGANFGEVGTERNGSFVRPEDDQGENQQSAAAAQSPPGPAAASVAAGQLTHATQAANPPKFRGKVPVEYFFH